MLSLLCVPDRHRGHVADLLDRGSFLAHVHRPSHPDEDGAPDPGVAKCCQAHVFAIDRAVATTGPGKSHPLQSPFVGRWSSFIADEPSPPPIAALTHA